jgi:hypothetical protein
MFDLQSTEFVARFVKEFLIQLKIENELIKNWNNFYKTIYVIQLLNFLIVSSLAYSMNLEHYVTCIDAGGPPTPRHI